MIRIFNLNEDIFESLFKDKKMVELVSTMPPHEIVSILKRNLGFGPKLANRTAGLLIRRAKHKANGNIFGT
jgi:hypothetical protein